jgi:23S rRNA (guanosine2251-2'-O)-methyltransferase
MTDETIFEIRLCESCGLRYPLVIGHAHGARCPICLGDTRVVLSRKLNFEPQQNLTPDSIRHDDSRSAKRRRGFSVLLDNIRSAWNVGSIFRSADGFGFDHAYVCGITPTPENEAVQKTSLGAEDSVPWSYHKDAVKLIKGLKREGWHTIGLEENARGIDLNKSAMATDGTAKASVLIVGNEITGVDPDLLDLCDEIATIPMRGGKKSLNAAMAFAVAAYALTASH